MVMSCDTSRCVHGRDFCHVECFCVSVQTLSKGEWREEESKAMGAHLCKWCPIGPSGGACDCVLLQSCDDVLLVGRLW